MARPGETMAKQSVGKLGENDRRGGRVSLGEAHDPACAGWVSLREAHDRRAQGGRVITKCN